MVTSNNLLKDYGDDQKQDKILKKTAKNHNCD